MVYSMDSRKNGDSKDRKPEFPDKNSVSAEKKANDLLVFLKINKMLEILDDRERQVIEWSFGLWEGESLAIAKIGKILGVSSQRAHQIRQRALRKLKDAFKEPLREMWRHSQ